MVPYGEFKKNRAQCQLDLMRPVFTRLGLKERKKQEC